MRRGRFVDRTLDKVVVGLLLVGLFAYISTRPTARLRVDLPPEFLDAPESWPPEKGATEEKVARAYWYCVVTVIQRKYKFGDPLPMNPPAEFKISAPDLPKEATDSDTRLRYWHRLQQIWYWPSIWGKEQRWDLHWATDWVDSVVRQVHDWVGRLFGA
jgi:hypothetical protein